MGKIIKTKHLRRNLVCFSIQYQLKRTAVEVDRNLAISVASSRHYRLDTYH